MVPISDISRSVELHYRDSPGEQGHRPVPRGESKADWTALGKRLYAPAFLEYHTRRLHIIDVTAHPTEV
jgi:hypothetical protein